jgi:hypothetical protein
MQVNSVMIAKLSNLRKVQSCAWETQAGSAVVMECFRYFEFYSDDNESFCDAMHKPLRSRSKCHFV